MLVTQKKMFGLQMHVCKLPAVIPDNYRIFFNLIFKKGPLPLHSCCRGSADVDSRLGLENLSKDFLLKLPPS